MDSVILLCSEGTILGSLFEKEPTEDNGQVVMIRIDPSTGFLWEFRDRVSSKQDVVSHSDSRFGFVNEAMVADFRTRPGHSSRQSMIRRQLSFLYHTPSSLPRNIWTKHEDDGTTCMLESAAKCFWYSRHSVKLRSRKTKHCRKPPIVSPKIGCRNDFISVTYRTMYIYFPNHVRPGLCTPPLSRGSSLTMTNKGFRSCVGRRDAQQQFTK